MIRKILAAALVVTLLATNTASAHVLVTDNTRQVGAILHIMPDDDPVAGKPGDIYYDIQSSGTLTNAVLSISDSDERQVTVPTEVNGSAVSAVYTFPNQGAYRIVLNVQIDGQDRTFEQSQRVSRGNTIGAETAAHQSWGEPLVIFSLAGFCVLIILAFNRLRYTNKNVSRKRL